MFIIIYDKKENKLGLSCAKLRSSKVSQPASPSIKNKFVVLFHLQKKSVSLPFKKKLRLSIYHKRGKFEVVFQFENKI